MSIKYWRICTALFVIVASMAVQQSVQAQTSPPPEAIATCEGKSADDACSFTAPDGNTITGTCQTVESVLACVPENPPTDTPTATPSTTPTATPTPTVSPVTTATLDPSTLSYPIVDTAQETCYDAMTAIICPADGAAFAGQDAQITGNAPSYTDNGDGTVTDNVTGLMWSQSPDLDGDGNIDVDDKLTYAEAGPYCDALALGGYDDWRLPDIKTLYSLMDFRGTDPNVQGTDTTGLIPFIDPDYFAFGYGDTNAGERIIDAQFASTTLYVSTVMDNMQAMFGLNLADGRIKGYPTFNKTFYVYCVRGDTSYGVNDFNDNGDNTITDNATGLMWDKNDNGTGVTWEDALAWVEEKNDESYLGYNDWRLPNAKELQSLVDYTRSPDTTNSAAINALFNATSLTNMAGQTDYGFYWSSTTHKRWNGSGGAGVYIAFGRGLGTMDGGATIIDVHGAGCQRSDPKTGDPDDYPSTGNGPQGDVSRVFNFVRLVRDADVDVEPTPTPSPTPTPTFNYFVYLPLVLRNVSGGTSTIPTPSPSPSPSPTPEPTSDGYTLFAPLNETATYLLDAAGDTAYTWSSTYRPGHAVYLLENDNLLRTGNTQSSNFDSGGAGGIVEEIAPDGTVVWSYTYDTTQHRLHHDVEPLPNGNVLMLAWELKTEAQALAAGCDPSLLSDGELWPDSIIEVDPDTDAIVWEWHVWDHLVQDYDANQANYGVVADHPELIDLNYRGTGARPGSADWNHTNAIDYNAEFDQVLLSVRNLSEIWIIDHSTTTAQAAGHSGGNSGMGGDLLYRWGNPQACDAGTAADQQLFVQHDAEWIPSGYPGAGNILVFNNGTGRSDGDYSSVDELVPPVDSNGNYTGYGPSVPTWSYTAATPTDFYANQISGAQRLSNGNTLICDGPDGYIFEVTSSGEVVWEYDHGNVAIFRATRYQSDYPGLPPISQ